MPVSYSRGQDTKREELVQELQDLGLIKDAAQKVGEYLRCQDCNVNCLIGECTLCSKSVCFDCSYTFSTGVQYFDGPGQVVKHLGCDACVQELFREEDPEEEVSEPNSPDYYDSDNEPRWL